MKLGELLLKKGLISKEQLDKALELQKKNHSTLRLNLVRLGFVSDDEIAYCLGRNLEIPSIDLWQLAIDRSVLDIVPPEVCRKYELIPIHRTGAVLTVAMADPTDIRSMDVICHLCGYQAEPVLALPYALKEAINKYYGSADELEDTQVTHAAPEEFYSESKIDSSEFSSRGRIKTTSSLCPYCKSEFIHDVEIVACANCRTFYHSECWSASGRCSVFGCPSESVLTRAGHPLASSKRQEKGQMIDYHIDQSTYRIPEEFSLNDRNFKHAAINESSRGKITTVLRWFLVLPASVVSAVLINLLVALFNILAGSHGWPTFWVQLINSVLSGYIFVLAGAKTAPDHRPITAIVLTSLFAFTGAVLITLSAVNGSSEPLWWLTLCVVISLIAAIVECFRIVTGVEELI